MISAWLDESSTNHAFGLQPRVDHSVEQVAGMDEAFLYHYLDEGYWRLITLQKNLPSTNYLAGEYDAFPGQPDRDAPVSTGIYDAAEYDIHISAPDKDEVLKIAEGLVTPR